MNKYLEKIAEMQDQDNHFWRNAAIGGATLGVAAGGALLARKGLAKLRTPKTTPPTLTPENFSSRSPAHKEFHDDIENLRKEVLGYHIFAEGNAQRIPWKAEETLHSKYPRVLARPLTPEKLVKADDHKREVMSDYIRHHNIEMKLPEHEWGWDPLYPSIMDHLHRTERAKARDIVAQHVKGTIGD